MKSTSHNWFETTPFKCHSRSYGSFQDKIKHEKKPRRHSCSDIKEEILYQGTMSTSKMSNGIAICDLNLQALWSPSMTTPMSKRKHVFENEIENDHHLISSSSPLFTPLASHRTRPVHSPLKLASFPIESMNSEERHTFSLSQDIFNFFDADDKNESDSSHQPANSMDASHRCIHDEERADAHPFKSSPDIFKALLGNTNTNLSDTHHSECVFSDLCGDYNKPDSASVCYKEDCIFTVNHKEYYNNEEHVQGSGKKSLGSSLFCDYLVADESILEKSKENTLSIQDHVESIIEGGIEDKSWKESVKGPSDGSQKSHIDKILNDGTSTQVEQVQENLDCAIHSPKRHYDRSYDFPIENMTPTVPVVPQFPAFGFSTARGKSLHMPDESAMKKATSLFMENEPDSDFINLNIKRTKMSDKRECSIESHNVVTPNSINTPFINPFSTAGGKKIQNPSEASIHRASSILNEPCEDNSHCAPFSAGFESAKGNKIAIPSSSLVKATEKFLKFENKDHCQLRTPSSNRKMSKKDVPLLSKGNEFRSLKDGAFQQKLFTPKSVSKSNPFTTPLLKCTNQQSISISHDESSKADHFLFTPIALFDLKAYKSRRVHQTSIHHYCHQLLWREKRYIPRSIGIHSPTTSLDIYRTPFECENFCIQSFTYQTAYEELLRRIGRASQLLSLEWVKIHYCQIIFKLLSYKKLIERNIHYFKESDFPSLITDEVIKQLTYRYERDLIENQRSILKKVMEKDEASCKWMILYVADIRIYRKKGENRLNKPTDAIWLMLSDGWYFIHAKLDYELQTLVQKRKIFIGQKLNICCSQFFGPTDGVSPLEVDGVFPKKIGTEDEILPTVYLNITYNSVKRASWNRLLGKCKSSQGSFSTSFSCLKPDGGLVPTIDMTILKCFPTCYLYGEARCVVNEKDITKLQHSVMDEEEDIHLKMEKENSFPTKLVSFVTFLVVETKMYHTNRIHCARKALLRIWRPDEGIHSIFAPGKRIKMCNLKPSKTKLWTESLIFLDSCSQTRSIPMVSGPESQGFNMTTDQIYLNDWDSLILREENIYFPFVDVVGVFISRNVHTFEDNRKDEEGDKNRAEEFRMIHETIFIGHPDYGIAVIEYKIKITNKLFSFLSPWAHFKCGDILLLQNLWYFMKDPKHHYFLFKAHSEYFLVHLLSSTFAVGIMKASHQHTPFVSYLSSKTLEYYYF